MKKITLKKIVLHNFRGIRDLVIEPGQETNIYGIHELGKSSILEGFLWLLFGKDSQDRKDHEIKTHNPDGSFLHRLEHEVSATLDVDGRETDLRRVHKEKWVKKRGSAEAEFTGHETEYFVNDVPLKEMDYKAKINELMEEGLFKLITNPLYFNESLKWQDRREILMNMAGITDEDVFSAKYYFEGLRAMLSRGKTLEGLKAQIAAQKKKIKDELDIIPARIQENIRTIPEDQDWSELENKILINKGTLSEIDAQLSDKAKAHKAFTDKQIEIQSAISQLRIKANRIKSDIEEEISHTDDGEKEAIRKYSQMLHNLRCDLEMKYEALHSHEAHIANCQKDRDDLRAQWHQVNGQAFHMDEKDCKCPTCQRAYETDDIEAKKAELEKNFNADKVRTLAFLNDRGTAAKRSQETAEKQVETISDNIASIKADIEEYERTIAASKTNLATPTQDPAETLEKRLAANKEYQSLLTNIAGYEAKISEAPKVDNSELLEKKKTVQQDIEDLNKQLAIKDQIEKMKARITELQDRERVLAQELADQERIEFTISEFTKAKIETLEGSINSRFGLVKFKMFNEQVNGGLQECCETTYKGVPWSVMNTAAKVQCGLDIIRTLSEHYGVQAPIVIDNRESVINIPDMDTQIINLYVSAKDKTLRVEVVKELAEAV